ncbi:MAG TPA: TIR domain-containing protein [Anaerolineales bacterium]|nr:TIR domain-containing protein [Anaerolineales bacterium]
MAKLFISYSRKDSKTAQKLINSLKEMGHDVWVDWESILPASDWLAQIYHGIEDADAFLFLVSPHSIISEVCNVEVGHAVLNNKRIVPVVIRQVKPEDTNEDVRKRNWVFLRRGDNYKEGLTRINEAIVLDFEWVEEHSRLQTRALEWDRKKDTSLLLRGGDLRSARRAVRRAKNKEPLPTELQDHYVNHSVAAERRRMVLISITAITLLLMTGLFFFALIQRNLAQENEAFANEQKAIAQQNEEEANVQRELAEANEEEANTQRELADEQRKFAEDQKLIAQAQRSAARAQIYQIQPGELYTSTLLAVDSWKTSTSDEAEEILRKNISLLPIPIPFEQGQHAGGINSLEFNPSRDLFVTGGVDGKTCVWKASDGALVYCSEPSPGSVNDAVFSPDGEFLVSGDASGEVTIIRTLDWKILHTYPTGAVVWDIDVGGEGGKDIAVTRDDGKITLLDLDAGTRDYDLEVSGEVRIASFSPDGNFIAAGSSAGVVNLWNLETNATPTTSGRHNGEVLALTFSPDSRYIITGGADGYAVVARVTTGQELYRRLHEDAVTDVAFNPNDASWFATVSNDYRIRLWDTFDGDERLRMSQDSFVEAVDISSNDQWLATTGADRTVRVWNASTGAEMFRVPVEGEGKALGFGGDGSTLVAADKTGEINIWDISEMPAPESYLQFTDLIGDVQFSPSGEWFAASAGARFWVLRTEQLSTLTATPSTALNIKVTGNISSLIFSPNSKWLGISTDAGQVLVYNLETQIPKTFTSSGVEHDIAFSPGSVFLLMSQPEGGVDAWNLVTGDQTVAFAGGVQEVISMAVNSTQIALGVEDEILILNESGERVLSVESRGDHSLLAFNADGSMLASSNSEGFIEIWKLEDGAFNSVGSIQKETVYAMAFNPAGTQLAIGTTNTVYLLDPFTVEETARIPHAGIVKGISYSTDGSTMATTSLKAIQFWDLTKIQILYADDLVGAACSRLRANFSEAQWSNLFGDENYRLLCDDLPVP